MHGSSEHQLSELDEQEFVVVVGVELLRHRELALATVQAVRREKRAAAAAAAAAATAAAAAAAGAMASARREHGEACGTRRGGACDCGGVPFYECSIERTAAGFGMMIGSDCTVTAFNGEPSAGREAGVVLRSIIVRVNDVPVEDKTQIVEQIKAAPPGNAVVFRLIWGTEDAEPAVPPAAASSPRGPAAAASPGTATAKDAVREHTAGCGAKIGRPCDCGGVPCYTVQVTNVGAGYGMLIGADCTVTKFNGEPNAAKTAGVLLDSVIVRVNGVVVEDKKQLVAQIQVRPTQSHGSSFALILQY